MKKLISLLICIVAIYIVTIPKDLGAQALRVLLPVQGGTGISTSSPTDIGKCIKVLSDSPFKYELASCGGIGGDPTIIQIDGTPQSVGTPTLNFTGNSFAVTESPADTFTLRVSTTTLGLLASSISDFVSTVRTSISETIEGLTYTSGTGVLSLDSGYTIPTTTRAVAWDNKGNGTVTSVDMSVPTGLTIAGNPISTSGTLALTLTSGYTIPSTTRMTNADTAFSWGNHALSGYISDGNPYIFDRYGKTGWDMDAYQTVSYSFATTTRTFTLTPTGTDFSFWIQGVKYTYAATSTTITDTEGNWFIYFDINGVLQASQTPWVIGNNDKAFVVSIYWDATNDKAIIMDNEMHSWVMDASVHRIMHSTFGTRYGTGLAVTINGDNLDVGAGAIYDEDIKIDIVDDDTPDTIWEQSLTPASVPVYYRTGANGDWRRTASSTVPVFLDGTAMYINTFSTVWATTTVSNNQYVAYWVIASGDINNPVFVIPGQETGSSLAAARSGNLLSNMQFGDLPVQEFKVIARVIVQKIVGAPYYSLQEVADYRNVSDEPSTSFSGTDHGGLTGLLDDDHTQYLLADGTRSLTANWFPGNYSIYGLNSLTLTGTSTLGYASTTALSVVGNATLGYLNTTSTTGTSTFSGAVQIGSTAGANALRVNSLANHSNSTSVGGAVNITNTNSTGAGLVIYSNQGATASGRLLVIRADNTAFDEQALWVQQDGTNGAFFIDCTASSSRTIECGSISSVDPDNSALGISGSETGKGTVKITHTGTGTDVNASGLSIDLQGTGTASQGIYLTSTGGGTTGNLLTLRNGVAQDYKFLVTGAGNVGIATSSPSRLLTIAGGDAWIGGNLTATGTALFGYASSTALTVSGSTYLGSLSGLLKGTAGLIGTASNGTDYTLITGTTCSGNDKISAITASGAITCTADQTGAGGTPDWVKNASLTAITPTTTPAIGILINASSSIDALTVRIGTTTSATSTNLFSALGTFTNLVVNTLSTFLNVVVTGLLDVGGGSLEIPNGTAPVVDSIGEIGLDSSDDQLVMADGGGTARVFGTDEFRVVSLTMASSSLQFDSGDLLAVLGNKDGLEITQFRCYVVGGTSKVVNLTDGTNDTETITCGTTMTSDTDVATNDTFTADEIGSLEMGATTGTVNYLHFEAWARITRE